MSFKKLLGYLIVLFILVIILIYMLLSGPSQSDIQRQIDTANFCGSTEDCGLIINKCPFECNTYVNINEVQRINQSLEAFESKSCTTSCGESAGVSCVQNKCVSKRQ